MGMTKGDLDRIACLRETRSACATWLSSQCRPGTGNCLCISADALGSLNIPPQKDKRRA
jgi:hypothetical protein